MKGTKLKSVSHRIPTKCNGRSRLPADFFEISAHILEPPERLACLRYQHGGSQFRLRPCFATSKNPPGVWNAHYVEMLCVREREREKICYNVDVCPINPINYSDCITYHLHLLRLDLRQFVQDGRHVFSRFLLQMIKAPFLSSAARECVGFNDIRPFLIGQREW